MTQFDTHLPVAGSFAPRPTLQRLSPRAAFLSQLIAERYRLAPQRTKRRAEQSVAVDAYEAGTHATDLRMPAGYRRTVLA